MNATTHAEIVAALQSRWPEHRIARGLGRIEALCDLLGQPQFSCPVIQIAGTNGKGSTAIMIDALLRGLGLRVGRYSSPHLQDLSERIVIDGEPIPHGRFDEIVAEVMPYVAIVDEQRIDQVEMTFYEVMTALAYVAFSQAPVDVAVIEVGMGGTWDATSVADPEVAVITPIDYDHTAVLGTSLPEIATEKAGIIKAGSVAVLAAQQPPAAAVLVARAAQVGATVMREGVEFGLIGAVPAVGGQLIRLNTADGPTDDVMLPVFGLHMAHNAALALAACEAFLGGRALPADVVAEGFAAVEAPARLELVRSSPAVVLDTAHNPHGVRATLAGVVENFGFTPLIVVAAMMADKDVIGVLEELAKEATTVVATGISGIPRALEPEALAELSREVFGPERVEVAGSMAEAIETAVRLADEAGPGAGILVVGSVYAAGEARGLLVREGRS